MRAPSDQALQSDAEALHAAVNDLVRVYQFRDRDTICCYDISVTQCTALEVLVEKGPMRSNELARTVFLDKSTASRVVDALKRKGYVTRARAVDDGRAVSLSATAAGRQLYHTINRELIKQQAHLVRDLDPSVRRGAALLISRLARAAAERFRSGVSVGPPSCASQAKNTSTR